VPQQRIVTNRHEDPTRLRINRQRRRSKRSTLEELIGFDPIPKKTTDQEPQTTRHHRKTILPPWRDLKSLFRCQACLFRSKTIAPNVSTRTLIDLTNEEEELSIGLTRQRRPFEEDRESVEHALRIIRRVSTNNGDRRQEEEHVVEGIRVSDQEGSNQWCARSNLCEDRRQVGCCCESTKSVNRCQRSETIRGFESKPSEGA